MELLRILAQNRYFGPLLACLGIILVVLVYNFDTLIFHPRYDIVP